MFRRKLYDLLALTWGACIAVFIAADVYFIFPKVPEVSEYVVRRTLCLLVESSCDHGEFFWSELLLSMLVACVLVLTSAVLLLLMFRAIRFIPDGSSPDGEKGE